MKTLMPEMLVHIAQENTTLALCWSMILTDESEFYYTDSDKAIEFGGHTYQPYAAVVPSATSTTSNLAVDNMEVQLAWDGDLATETEIRGGRFDFATMNIFFVNFEDPDGMGSIPILKGKLGELVIEDNLVKIDVRGMTQYLQQRMGELYSVGCQATFGDARCKADASQGIYTKAFTVATVNGTHPKRTFTILEILGDADGYYTGGHVAWTGGSNQNTKMDIKVYFESGQQVELYEPLIRDIQVGDTGNIIVGCDKKYETCKLKFDNMINFRGFPHLTGVTKMLRGPE